MDGTAGWGLDSLYLDIKGSSLPSIQAQEETDLSLLIYSPGNIHYNSCLLCLEVLPIPIINTLIHYGNTLIKLKFDQMGIINKQTG
jgi:hypothetical protein